TLAISPASFWVRICVAGAVIFATLHGLDKGLNCLLIAYRVSKWQK
ncbi:MAG: hypothetical protein ACI9SC_001077, partial [Gammaproteobacteria bacterium]